MLLRVVCCLLISSHLLIPSRAADIDLGREKEALRIKIKQIFFQMQGQHLLLLDNLIDDTFSQIAKKAADCPYLVEEQTTTTTTPKPTPMEPRSTVTDRPPANEEQCGANSKCVTKDRCIGGLSSYRYANSINWGCAQNEVCCDLIHVSAERPIVPVTCAKGLKCVDKLMCNTLPILAINHTVCAANKVCCNPTKEAKCGERKEDPPSDRFLNNAGLLEFPWMASVLDEQSQFIAGAVIISNNKVLSSAALKNRDITKLKVRGGEWNRNNSDEEYPHQDRSIASIKAHEEYKRGKYNNIAVLQLKTPFGEIQNISPICLSDTLDAIDRTNCFATAWGSQAAILQSYPLSTIADNDCDLAFKNKGIRWFGPFIRDNLLCTDVEPRIESCGVDEGSPLVCPYINNPKQFALVGLATCGWSSAQASEAQLPRVYTDVIYSVSWIRNL